MPDFDGAVLFIEEMTTSPTQAERAFRHLAALGVPVCIADADERAMDALARELPPSDTVAYRLCDVADALQVYDAISAFQPRTIFHLAAKKHVKYAEPAVRNAVMTNVVGTWNAVNAARKSECVCNVVCASSDKAVAAANVATPLTAQNTFHMPALMQPDEAAQAMLRGWQQGRFEIHFPRRFSLFLKLLRWLPDRWYFSWVSSAVLKGVKK